MTATPFQAKLTPEQRGTIMASTAPAKDVATEYGVSAQTVYDLRQKARDEARRQERDAISGRGAAIRDLSEWDDLDYKVEDTSSRLHVPAEIIPEGIEYQWCTCEVFGQQMPQRLSWWQRQGWRSVPAERHPGRWTPLGATGAIIMDGLMLMERPKAWCDRARAHDQAKARGQMEAKKAQLRGGDLPGVSLDAQHPSAIRSNVVRSQYEKVNVGPADYQRIPNE